MTRISTLAILLAFVSTIFSDEGLAQPCDHTINDFVYTPPPVNGTYEPGQTVEICVDVIYDSNDSNWPTGIQINLPASATITNLPTPNTPGCGQGGWEWYESVTGSGAQAGTYGPGFFYDANGDGNPGNNWGPGPCSNITLTFCVEVTFDCGGGSNPYDGQSIVPELIFLGDGDIGSWIDPSTNPPPPANPSGCVLAPSPPPNAQVVTLDCCDASAGQAPDEVLICNNGPMDLYDELTGADSPGTWVDPNNNDLGPTALFDPLDPTLWPPGDYTYTVVGTDGCTSSTTVTMVYNDLGYIGNITFCADADSFYILDEISNPPATNGTPGEWYDPNMDLVVDGLVYPATGLSGTYTYIFQNANNCPTTALVYIGFSQVPSTGCATEMVVCNLDDPFSLFDNMGCDPQPFGIWIYFDTLGNFIDYYDDSFMFDPGVDEGGYYVYGQTIGGCLPPIYSYDTLTITVNEPANVGITTTVELCVNPNPVDFTDLLDGNPDPGYTWQNQGGDIISMPFDISTDTSGIWIYFGGDGLCFNSATLDLTIHPDTADAGTDLAQIVLCEGDPAFSLYETLGWSSTGDQGEWAGPDSTGTWSGPGGFTGDVNTQFDPSIHVTGQYTYTVVGDCSTDEAIVNIVVTDQADAGVDPPLIQVCDDDNNIYYLESELNGTPDGGGTWYDDAALTNPVSDQFIPAGQAPGNYTFYYLVGSSSCSDQSQVTFNVNNAPDPGLDGSITVCESVNSLDLFTGLGGTPDATGLWYDASTQIPGGIIDPSPATAGDYYYIIDDVNCGQYSSTVTVTVDPTPFVGNDVTTTTCEGTTLDLYTELDPGYDTPGSWSNAGNPHSGTFDANVDLPGVYTYTAGTGGCTNSVDVTVSITPMPNPGTDNTVSTCITAAPFDMFPELGGADTPGSWSSGTNIFTPGTDSPGVYTYTAQGSANCPDASADITIVVEDEMTATPVVEMCSNDQLTYSISFTATGQAPFSITSNSAGLLPSTTDFVNTGVFNSSDVPEGTAYNITFEDANGCNSITYSGLVDCACPLTATLSGDADICENSCTDLTIDIENGTTPYSLVYNDGSIDISLTGINTNTLIIPVCPTNTSTFTLVSVNDVNCVGSVTGSATVNVDAEPFAGTDISATLCSSDSPINLYDLLDSNGPADAGGSWSPSLTGGYLGTFTPGVSNAGTYTYTAGNGACADDQATVTIDYYADITVDSETTTCNASFTFYTVGFQINGGDNSSYSVTGANGGEIDPATGYFLSYDIATGTNYSYTVTDGNNCEQIIISGVSPNCACPVTASISGNATICEGSSTDITITASGGNGNYTLNYNEGGVPVTPALSGSGPWVISVNPSVTTIYTLVDVMDSNCIGTANGSVTVNVDPPVNAGANTSYVICEGEPAIDLFTLLGPNVSTTGSWSPALGNGENGTFDPSTNSSGPYTYSVDGGGTCPDESATVNMTVLELISVNSYTTCLLNNTEYTVTIEMSGGDGNYFIDGDSVGSSWTSDPIAEGTPYNYVVQDNNACNMETVSGPSPVCDCPASATISGTTSICEGGSAELTITTTGEPPFSFVYNNGSSDVTVNNVSSPHILNVNPAGTTNYTLVSMEDANCAGPVSGSATVTVNTAPVVSAETITCNSTGEFYTVTFTITGGTGTYNVDDTEDGSTSTSTGTYTSTQIASGSPYNFIVDDANNCSPVTISGSNTCVCLSDAGSMGTTPLDICANASGTATFNNDAFLDGNDIQKFVLHDGSPTILGNILAWYNSPTVIYAPEYVYGQVYYLSSVVGNTGSGNTVDLNDICFSSSNGTPVVFRELPSATISGGGWVCEDEQSEITLEFGGPGPFDYSYQINNGDTISDFSSIAYTTFNSVEPGIYTLTEISNNYCVGTVSGMAEINNYTTPTATLSGPETICIGSNLSPVVNLTGTGPWDLEYEINGEVQETVNSSSAYVNLDVEAGSYSLISISDNNCPGTVSGMLDVETPMPPTAIITGGGIICEGEEAEFNLNLTGEGPWNVQYSVNGLPQSTIQVTDSAYSFTSEMNGDYSILQVTDQNCSGEVLASFPSLIVNPIPTAHLSTSSPTICVGEELEVNFEFEGNGPFNVEYVVNGDTLMWNNVGNVINQTYTPDQEMVFELLYIEDNSNPQCSNELGISSYVGIFNLPNAPVLMDDTICADAGPLHIGSNGSSSLSYLWYPATNLSEPTSPNPIATLENNSGNYVTYQYTLTSSNGECEVIDTVNITLDPGPNVRFDYNPTKVTTEESTVKFHNYTGSEDFEYFWEFGNLETSTEFEPIFTFPEDVAETYIVNLMAIDPETGCMSERSKTINVLPELLIYIPNAFTPDGDGINDHFYPVLRNVDPSDYRFMIFNRFGEIVFETKEIDQFWNGSNMNSDYFVHPGVYVWKIITKNQLTLEEIELEGRVTVIR